MQQCDCAGMHPPEGIQDLKAILLIKKWILQVYEEGSDLYYLVKSARSSAGANLSQGSGVEPFQLLITDTGREGVKVHHNWLEGGLGILTLLNQQVSLALWSHNVHLLRSKTRSTQGLGEVRPMSK